MLMLVQALGTADILSVMTVPQILVFTLFILFYIPCLATITALVKEIGRKLATLTVLYSLGVATLIGVAARFLLQALSR